MEDEIIKDKNKEYIELEKENKGLIHISFSEFSKYMECGHRHLVEKYLKLTEDEKSIHLIFGNSIHSAIEMGLKKNWNIDKTVEHFKEEFVREMMNQMIDKPEYKEVDNFVSQGENILRILKIERIFEKYELIGMEIPLYEKLLNNFRFKGFIDLILKNKKTGRYLVLDWKTSSESWDVSKKKKNKIFMSQMRFYKYFYARKYNIPMDEIDCKYVVLNRLKSKHCPDLGYGGIQSVEIFSNEQEIKDSLSMLADSVKNIHIKNYFPKAKINGDAKSCFFCPLKDNLTLCNNDPEQYKQLLVEHKDKINATKSAN